MSKKKEITIVKDIKERKKLFALLEAITDENEWTSKDWDKILNYRREYDANEEDWEIFFARHEGPYQKNLETFRAIGLHLDEDDIRVFTEYLYSQENPRGDGTDFSNNYWSEFVGFKHIEVDEEEE